MCRLEPKISDHYANTPCPKTDAYADPEYFWDEYIQS